MKKVSGRNGSGLAISLYVAALIVENAASTHGGRFKGKPAAAVASCMRSGANSTIDRINKYFSFSEMPIVSSNYWNMLFDTQSQMGTDEKGNKNDADAWVQYGCNSPEIALTLC